ncbi:MAG: hypothetical protein VKJ66_08140 [Synechococcus sp.]|nr:hypothetical protein [Synechococcus sp.]
MNIMESMSVSTGLSYSELVERIFRRPDNEEYLAAFADTRNAKLDNPVQSAWRISDDEAPALQKRLGGEARRLLSKAHEDWFGDLERLGQIHPAFKAVVLDQGAATGEELTSLIPVLANEVNVDPKELWAFLFPA